MCQWTTGFVRSSRRRSVICKCAPSVCGPSSFHLTRLIEQLFLLTIILQPLLIDFLSVDLTPFHLSLNLGFTFSHLASLAFGSRKSCAQLCVNRKWATRNTVFARKNFRAKAHSHSIPKGHSVLE